MARQLVELGYRGSGEVLKREEFEARKQQAEASRLAQRNKTKYVYIGICMIDIYPSFDKRFHDQTNCLVNKPCTVSPLFCRQLAHQGKDIKDPFLKALANREESNRSGKMTVSQFM